MKKYIRLPLALLYITHGAYLIEANFSEFFSPLDDMFEKYERILRETRMEMQEAWERLQRDMPSLDTARLYAKDQGDVVVVRGAFDLDQRELKNLKEQTDYKKDHNELIIAIPNGEVHIQAAQLKEGSRLAYWIVQHAQEEAEEEYPIIPEESWRSIRRRSTQFDRSRRSVPQERPRHAPRTHMTRFASATAHSFHSMTVPGSLDLGHAFISYEHGELTITIPKSERAARRRSSKNNKKRLKYIDTMEPIKHSL